MDAEHTDTNEPAATTTDRVPNPVDGTRGARATTPNGQLHLHVGDLADRPDWRLDEETRAVGRRGIAQARAALRSARADHLDRSTDERADDRRTASSHRRTAA